MKLSYRILSVLLLVLTVVVLFLFSAGASTTERLLEGIGMNRPKTTLRIWYSDDALTDYLAIRVAAYNEQQNTVRIEPTLVSGVEYLENINHASLNGEVFPDLYITTNDTLEKAHLAGLTTDVGDMDGFLSEEHFALPALNAVTYQDKFVALPFYYETSVLMYNRTYLEEFARSVLAGERAQGETISDDEVRDRALTMVPDTIAELLSFADNYSAPADVESVFKWDVTDIFYNYFIIGNYMNAGGPAGDTKEMLNVYNTEMISCMKAYQKLGEYFAIDASEVSYDKIVDEFIAGKMVFTVVTSDAVTRIRAAQNAGECEYTYGVAPVPDLNDFYPTRTMSVTDCVVINGYTEHYEEAQAFAKFLVDIGDESIFRQAGKLPARKDVAYEDPNLNIFYQAYASSIPMPKMIETSNLWMRLEIAFTLIWNGADCNLTLKELSESVMQQIVWQHYEEKLLPEPDMVSITDESIEGD